MRPDAGGGDFPKLREQLTEAFGKADTAEVVRLLHDEFGKGTYTMRSLFRDERRKILNLILNDLLEASAGIFRNLYDSHAQIMRFLVEMGAPVPKGFRIAGEIALNAQLRKVIASDPPDGDAVRSVLKEAGSLKVELDATTLEYAIRKRLEAKAEELAAEPMKLETAEQFLQLLELAELLPFRAELSTVQNVIFTPLGKLQEYWESEEHKSESQAQKWTAVLGALWEKLKL